MRKFGSCEKAKLFIAFFVLSVIFVLVNTNEGFTQDSISYRTFSLSDIGYTKGISLRGTSASHDFYVPLSNPKIVSGGSFIRLEMEFSPVLPGESLLRVDVNDNSASTFSLGNEKSRSVFKIPIQRSWIRPDDETIKITVSADQFISEDFRYEVSALWANILPSSFIQIASEGERNGKPGISNFLFLLNDEKRVTLAIPKIPSAEEAESAVWIYAFLKRELGDEGAINIVEFINRDIESWVPFILGNNLIIIGKGISVGRQTEVPDIRLIESDVALPDNEQQTRRILLITGENDDQVQRSASGFLEEGIRNSSFGNSLFIKKRIELYEGEDGSVPQKRKISLRELGFSRFAAEGMGKKRMDVFFSLGSFPQLPKNLNFVIFGEHTPVDREIGSGFLNVYINGSLIKSFDLEGEDMDGLYVPIPSYLIGRENTLGIEFSYLPLREGSENSAGGFKGVVYSTSYLEAKGEETAEALFEHLPWFLLDPDFQIYFKSPPGFENIEVAGELLYLLWKTHAGKEIYPRAVIGQFPQEGNLMAVLSPSDLEALGLLPPLLPVGNLRVIDYRTQQIIWGVEDGMSLGIIEVFKDRERNILLGTFAGEDGKRRLIGFLDLLGEENNFLSMGGNIALGDGAGNMYAFKEEELKIEYPKPELLTAFWEQYRLVAFICAWLLLVSFTVFIYFRFQRRVAR